VKLNVHEIEEVEKTLSYEEPTESLNPELTHGGVRDFEFHAPAAIELSYYRGGRELFFRGHITAAAIGYCARCTEPYDFEIDADFHAVLLPRPEETDADGELDDEQLDVGYYDDDLVDLTPMIHDQVIVALPTRPLCDEDCLGLCPQCGNNRNINPCTCTASTGDPRLAVLRQIKLPH